VSLPGDARKPPDEPGRVIDPKTGSARTLEGLKDTAVCPDCSVIVVRDGITTLQTNDDTVREIGISGGTIAQLNRAGIEISLTVPNVYRPGDGSSALEYREQRFQVPYVSVV